jgi:hypothetical protein
MIRRFISKINDLPLFWPPGESLSHFSLKQGTAEIYVDAFEETLLTPELLMLRSTWL